MGISVVRVAVAAVVLTAGCATTHQLAPKPAADSISPGKVQIELYRRRQWYGTGNGFTVKDHGQEIGTLGTKGTLLWESDPGDLDLLVGPAIFNMGDFHQVTMKLDTENRYSFETWFPFWYPFSHTGLRFLNKIELRESTAAETILSPETARPDALARTKPTDERIGRGKTSSSFHYFTDVEYSCREVDLKRGVWDSRKAGLKDLTARFGIRHLPRFIQRIAPKFNGHLEYFFSATAEQLRQESIYKGAPWPTTDIVHTGLSPVIGLGLGANTWGPGRLLLRTRLEVRYGEYEKVSYSRRFAGNEYDVKADILVFSESIDFELRYQLGHFEPFLAYNRYDFSLDWNLIHPNPCVGTTGDYVDVSRNITGLAIGTWIKLKPDINLRFARHLFNQDTYTVQTEMRF